MDAASAVIARLREGQPPWCDVRGLLTLSELHLQALNRTPALFVLMLAEDPGPDSRSSGPALQSVKQTLGVVLVDQIRNQRAPDMTPLRQELRRRLFGFQPGAQFEPLVLGAGHLLSVEQGQVSWVDRFITEYTEDANRQED